MLEHFAVHGVEAMIEATPPSVTVRCPWPWCPGTATITTFRLDDLIDALVAFRADHNCCRPTFTVEVTP